MNVQIPEKPPLIAVLPGDSVIVMGVRGLPRLEDRRHYANEEIEAANFAFSKYTVIE